jgi:hypothetical protein
MSLPKIEIKKLLRIVSATNRLTAQNLMHTKKSPQPNASIPLKAVEMVSKSQIRRVTWQIQSAAIDLFPLDDRIEPQ